MSTVPDINPGVVYIEGNEVEIVSLLGPNATPSNSPKVIRGNPRKQIILADPLTGAPLDLQNTVGGASTFASLTDKTTADIPATNGPTSTALAGKLSTSSLGTGVATFLATPSSANLAAAVTNETGSGALVFATSPALTTPNIGTPSAGVLTSCTGLPLTTGVTGVLPVANFATGSPTGTKFVRDDGVLAVPAGGGSGDALTSNPLSQFAATTSLQLLGVMSDETGTGSLVFATSPALVTPNIGTPSAGVLTSCTGLPVATGISGLAAGVATFLATPSSANLAAAVTNETGSGALVFATSPALVTPALGTPASGNLSNCTNIPGGQITGLATGMTTFLATPTSANLIATVTDETGTGSLVFATSPVLVTPNIGTPSAGTLTSCTGLPVATGVSGLGTGIATFLATPSSANLAAAVTNETGSGALVFGTSPTIATPTVNSPTVNHAKPAANSTVVGDVVSGYNAGATITQFQVVYMSSAGTWQLADADGSGTRQASGLAAAAGTSGNPMDVLDNGIARLDSWTWTPGGKVYLSATPGGLTQTAPTSGAEVVCVGRALSATEIRVRIDSFSVTV